MAYPDWFTWFQDEMDLVDATKVLVPVIDAVNYDENEWSYDGLTVTGYDEYAIANGMASLMYDMGFRYYAPQERFIKRPTEIATDLTAIKQSFLIPNTDLFLAYGYDTSSRTAAQNAVLVSDWERYRVMNNVINARLPAGHRYVNIITNSTAFFNANPDLLWPGRPDCLNLAVAEPRLSVLVEYCAAFLLNAGFNVNNRTNFDATDGDPNTTDNVWSFSKRVIDKVRAGTAAIGTFDAQAANPTAQIGVYIYGSHRRPPTVTDLSGVYASLALAFNNTEYTYLELAQAFGERCDFIALREYFDTMVWSLGIPQNNSRVTRKYLNSYAQYLEFGVRGVNSEFQANWLANMVGTYTFCRYARTGGTPTTIFDQTITDMVNDIFDGDEAVHRLLTLWGGGRKPLNKYSLKTWTDIIDDMAESWYRTAFESYMVIMDKYDTLPDRSDEVNFPLAFSSLMANVQYISWDQIFHSYAFIRRLANTWVGAYYPELKYNAGADWKLNPYPPTHDEYLLLTARLAVTAFRSAFLDLEDMIVVEVTPESGTTAANNPLNRIRVGDTRRFAFVGPGTAVFAADAPEPNIPDVTGPEIKLSNYGLSEAASVGDLVGTLSVLTTAEPLPIVPSGPIIEISDRTTSEDAAIGALVGTLSIRRNISGTYTYSITDDPDDKFVLDLTNNTRLELKNTLDYATASSHTVTISASNGVDAPTVRQLIIAVVPSSYTFSITADPDSKFVLDLVTNNRLELENTLDYDTATSHTVTIQADNGVDVPLSRELTINVGEVIELAYGPGIHYIQVGFPGAGYASAADGGKIFVYAFPNFNFPYYLTSNGVVDLWMYVPVDTGDAGRVDMAGGTGGRCVIAWDGSSVQFGNSPTAAQLASIPSGQLRMPVGEPNNRGFVTFGNVNPWLSPYANFAFMSRSLAEQDFPTNRVKISVPEFEGTDDAEDPEIDENAENSGETL